jgi:hypothetical protein
MPSLPRAVPKRLQFTGDHGNDRAQRMAQEVGVAHEQTKAVVSDLATRLATAEASLASAVALIAASVSPKGGIFLLNVVVTTAGVSLAHTLGRIPIGYVLTRTRAASTPAAFIFGDNGAHTTTLLNLIARCSAAGAQNITVDLYLF